MMSFREVAKYTALVVGSVTFMVVAILVAASVTDKGPGKPHGQPCQRGGIYRVIPPNSNSPNLTVICNNGYVYAP